MRQLAIAHYECQACFIVCDHRETLPLGGVAIFISGEVHHVTINGVHVPVVNANLKIVAGGKELYYSAFVNELTDGVLETLANQAKLPIVLVDPLGVRIGKVVIDNGILGMVQKQFGKVSAAAEVKEWTPHHFAAARAYVASQHPTAEDLFHVVLPQ